MRLKIGVMGAGHLGKIHLKCISLLPEKYELVGFYDPNPEVAKTVSEELGYQSYPTIHALIEKVDVVDIVTPTLSHYDVALEALNAGKHLFVEKPITHTVQEANHLIEIANANQLKAQVGHVERFNPAFTASRPFLNQPMFIETHRLAEFNPRGTDVSVVMDLMIHDLDIVLSIVKSPLKKIHASGVAVVSETPDICNARLEFENGCVANLTASRISLKNMRKTRLFQKDAYITVDFLEKVSEVITMKSTVEEDPYAMVLDLPDGSQKQIIFQQPEISESNAIKDELESLANSITSNEAEVVSLEDGKNALEVAIAISEQINSSSKINLHG